MTAGRLNGRVALVTGASRGLGAAVAVALAASGAHVVATARTVGGLEALDDRIRAGGGHATLVPFDLQDLDRIDVLGASLYQRFGRLDILVGNAAMLGHFGPVAHVQPRLWDQVMAVNLAANYRLIRSFDRLLRASDAGRALFTTCAAARESDGYQGVYGVSKAALEQTVRLYAAETATTRVRVNLVDPGVIRTKLRAEGFPGEDPLTVAAPETAVPLFLALADPACARHGERVGSGAEPA